MATNLDRYKKNLEELIALGERMLGNLLGKPALRQGLLAPRVRRKVLEDVGTFEREYQNWYTEASAVIRQLTPDRLPEFQELYKGDGKRKNTTTENYNIRDWLMGIRCGSDSVSDSDLDVAVMRFQTQANILRSTGTRFESRLHDIRQLVQADLFDSELEASRELLKSEYLRAAGVMAGVVLENHLEQVAGNHTIAVPKKNPTIGDWNELLKKHEVIDHPAYHMILHLSSIRNICGHKRAREPEKEEVQELIDGTYKITKTIF